MNISKRIIYLAILLSVLFFVLDALIGSTYYKELNFIEVLFTATPYHELYSRLIAITLIAVFGILVYSFVKNEPAKVVKQLPKEHKISSDPMLMVNVSNHIRTPLNAIQGFIELLNDPGINENSKRLYLNHIKTSSKYLLELINNVTDITLLEAKSLFIDKGDCKLNELMSEIQSKYSNVIREKEKRDLSIMLKTNIEDKEFLVQTDRKRLRQVLENLLENSTTYTDTGVIEFGFNAQNDDNIEFFVKDSGSGISAERLEMVFSKTSNVIDNKMAPFDLASLRMNIAKQVIQLMGGELKAKSEINKGSDFSFILPIRIEKLTENELLGEELKEVETPLEKVAEKKLQWSDKTILIAEDVESNFIYLQETLKETGAEILWAENGKIAYETVISNSEIDVVLMDILMPEMDGYEATIKIKKEMPHLPIVAQTAYHLDENDYKDASLYFNKILIKPIWSHDLMATLKEILH